MMRQTLLNHLCFLLLLATTDLVAQQENYRYQMPLDAPQDLYHRITLPDGIYDKVQRSMADIRIYGESPEGVGFEVPYLVKNTAPYTQTTPQNLAIFNSSSKGNRYYFSFKMEALKEMQQLKLQFAEQNFDWLIDLEGSDDGLEWFLISKQNRVVSINNNQTSYTYSTITFPPAQYRFLRISLAADQAPSLNSAQISREYINPGVFVDYEAAHTTISLAEKNKKTKILLDLGTSKLISYIKFDHQHNFDFFRPVRIEFLADSTTTEKGVHYRYHNATRGYLSSFENNEFHFSAQITRQILITINNQDNEPLNVGNISIKGNPTELIARFGKKGKYLLCYGNKKAQTAKYDLEKFKSNIPATLNSLSLGEEIEIPEAMEANSGALFENPLWMWVVLILIILLLGTFTLKMFKSEQHKAKMD